MNNGPIQLTAKQGKWLITHFKHTKNAECAAKLGISEASLHRIARSLGLKKTPQFIKKCQQESLQKAWRSSFIKGSFPPKGYHIPNRDNYFFKKGETGVQRLGKKKELERQRKAQESLRATRASEKRRVLFGLPQRTKLKVVKQSVAKVKQRSYLKSHGYIIDEDKRIAYWTSETHRAPQLEAREQKIYQFAELPRENKLIS